MTLVEALRQTVGGGRAVRPGSGWAYQVRGAGGSVFAIDLDPGCPTHRKELPSGPNNIRHLMADDWVIDARDLGPTLRSLFPAASPLPEPSLTVLYGLDRERGARLTLGDLLRDWQAA